MGERMDIVARFAVDDLRMPKALRFRPHDPTDRYEVEEWDGTREWVSVLDIEDVASSRSVVIAYKDEVQRMDLETFLSQVRGYHSPNRDAAVRLRRVRGWLGSKR